MIRNEERVKIGGAMVVRLHYLSRRLLAKRTEDKGREGSRGEGGFEDGEWYS